VPPGPSCVVAEETGLIGALILIGLLAWLVVLGFRTAARAPDRLGTLYALGSSFILGFQTLLNLGVVVGVVRLLLGVARQTRHEPSLSLTQEVAG